MNPSKNKSPKSNKPKPNILKPKPSIRKPRAHGPPKGVSPELNKKKLVSYILSKKRLPNDIQSKIMYNNVVPHSGLPHLSPKNAINNVYFKAAGQILPSTAEMQNVLDGLAGPEWPELSAENLANLAAALDGMPESKNSRKLRTSPKVKKHKAKPKQLKPKHKPKRN